MHLSVLGGLRLRTATDDAVTLARRRLALLAVLAVAGDHGVGRERLVSLLWPDASDDAGRHSLEQLLSVIRRQLGESIFLGPDPVRLDPASLTSDVAQFERALEQGDLASAAALYGGPFLDSFHLTDAKEFEEWVDRERGRLARRHREALEHLARDATARGEHREAAGWWRSLALVDPLGTAAAVGLMRALAQSGDRTAALQHARVHEALVRDQLEVAPDPAIAALVDQIEHGAFVAQVEEPTPRSAAGSGPDGSSLMAIGRTLPATVAPGRQQDGNAFRRARRIASAAVVAVIAAFALWRVTMPQTEALRLGRSIPVTSEPGLEIFPDLSPDGALVAYAAGTSAHTRIFIRPVTGGRTIALTEVATVSEEHPKWSPDGAHLLFLSRETVWIASALGGTSRPILPPSPTGVSSASWSADGMRVVVVRGDSLLTVATDGTDPSLIATDRQLHSCAASPNGAWVACVSMNGIAHRLGPSFGNLAPSGIVLFPIEGGPGRTLVTAEASNHNPVWSPDSRELLFLSDRDGPHDIYALSVSRSGERRGEAARLTTGLGAFSFGISRDRSRIVYSAYRAQSNLWSLPHSGAGVLGSADATRLTSGNQVIEAVRVSRDGRWVVYDSNLGGRARIWRVPASGGAPEQLTRGSTDEFAGDLSPDGRSVAYHSFRRGSRDIEVLPLDGGEARAVTASPGQESYPVWSRDGTKLLFVDQVPPSTALVVTRRPDGTWSAPVALQTNVRGPQWSADDRSLVWVSATDGSIWVAPVDGGAAHELYPRGVVSPPARRVAVAPDGRIFFKSHDDAGRASFWVLQPAGAPPRLVARLEDLTHPSSRAGFDVDAQRLYFQVEDRQSDVIVVEVVRP